MAIGDSAPLGRRHRAPPAAAHFFGAVLYRLGVCRDDRGGKSASALAAVPHHRGGPDSLAAIILETIPGTAGIFATAGLPRGGAGAAAGLSW